MTPIKKFIYFLIAFPIIWVSACSNASQNSMSGIATAPVAKPSVDTSSVIPTYSPAEIATSQSAINPLPTAPIGYPTALPPFNNTHYVFDSVRFIKMFAIRMWHDPFTGVNAITISKTGQPSIELQDRWVFIDDLSGTDITNTGIPALIIRTETGGGICCTSIIVYNLGEQAKKIMDIQAGNAKGYFTDLNDDGVNEFVAFDYWNLVLVGTCMACMQPIPVILGYQPAIGYVISSTHFQDFYDKKIADTQKKINQVIAKDPNNQSLIDLVGYVALCYLYSGRTEKGWSVIDQYLKPEVASEIRIHIQDVLQKSTLYVKP